MINETGKETDKETNKEAVNNDLISVNGLSVKFGKKTVLKNIDTGFKKGEFVVIAGNNGAGKTTFLRCLMEILTPNTGEVVYGNGLTKNKIGFISDRFSFFEDYTLKQGIDLHSRIYHIDKYDDSLVKHLGLDMNDKVKTLSLGERVMFLFSLLMSQKPELILIDEILHAIDPYIREMFLEYLLEVIEKNNTTVISINHTFSEIETIPDRIMVLENGEFLIDEPAETLKSKIKCVESDKELPADIPVLYKKKVLNYDEYYVYPFTEETGKTHDLPFRDLAMSEIIKSFIGGYYVKKRISRGY